VSRLLGKLEAKRQRTLGPVCENAEGAIAAAEIPKAPFCSN